MQILILKKLILQFILENETPCYLIVFKHHAGKRLIRIYTESIQSSIRKSLKNNHFEIRAYIGKDGIISKDTQPFGIAPFKQTFSDWVPETHCFQLKYL